MQTYIYTHTCIYNNVRRKTERSIIKTEWRCRVLWLRITDSRERARGEKEKTAVALYNSGYVYMLPGAILSQAARWGALKN